MKRILAPLVLLLSLVLLTACSSQSPTNAADAFLSAIKNGDAEAIAANYVNEEFDLFESASEAAGGTAGSSDEDSPLTKVYQENLAPKMRDFEYSLSNEKINGDNATVDVSVKTYQLGSAFTEFFSEYMVQAFALAFSNPSEEQSDALAANILTSKIDNLTEKAYEKTVTLSMVKKDDKWLVDKVDGNKDVLNALSGGIVDATANMATAFGR